MTPHRPSPDASSGARGEALAAAFLIGQGYILHAQNLRTRHGEIDLLVRDDDHWVAVEVKARKDHPAPERTVLPSQLDRIERALKAVSRSLRPRPRTLRIDLVAIRWRVGGEPEVLHFPAVRAFRREDRPCGSASVPEWVPADIGTRGVASPRRLWSRMRRWFARVFAQPRLIRSLRW